VFIKHEFRIMLAMKQNQDLQKLLAKVKPIGNKLGERHRAIAEGQECRSGVAHDARPVRRGTDSWLDCLEGCAPERFIWVGALRFHVQAGKSNGASECQYEQILQGPHPIIDDVAATRWRQSQPECRLLFHIGSIASYPTDDCSREPHLGTRNLRNTKFFVLESKAKLTP